MVVEEHVEKEYSSNRYSELIPQITMLIHSYKVRELGVSFVDREDEVKAFLYPAKTLSNGIILNDVTVVTGPKGCGKTELVYALLHALRDSRDYALMHLTWGEEELETITSILNIAGLGVRNVIGKLLKKTIPWITGKIFETLTGFKIQGLLGSIDLLTVIEYAGKLYDRIILVVVDEFRGKQETIRQQLEVTANIISMLGNRMVKLIYLTSDATVELLKRRIGGKISWTLMWNIPKQYFKKLYMQLNPQETINYNLVWNLTGGNPRELVDLKQRHAWDINSYIARKIDYIKPIYRYTEKLGALSYLKEIIENPDNFMGYLGTREVEDMISFKLLSENIMINISGFHRKLTVIEEEEWIGENYAFQTPVYYWVLKSMVEYRTNNISPRQVMQLIESKKQDYKR